MALSCESAGGRPREGDTSGLLLLLLFEFSNLARRLRTPPEAGRAAIVCGVQWIIDTRLRVCLDQRGELLPSHGRGARRRGEICGWRVNNAKITMNMSDLYVTYYPCEDG